MDEQALRETAEELGETVALVKAHLVGRDRVADSNVVSSVDDAERVFIGAGALPPPYDPETLCLLLENSNSLRQNIDAYVTNIDAFGHRFEPVLDLDASDADQRIANALAIERSKPGTAGDAPTPEEVAAKRREVAELMRLEKSRIENFFEYCCTDGSFVTLRRRTRLDVELLGNGYWEILRNGAGEIVQFVYVPGFTVRLLPLDPDLVEVDHKVKGSDLRFDTMRVRTRFRRYVQVFESQTVYFREFGDPRVVSRKTGQVFAGVDALLATDPSDGPATEILHFKVMSPRSTYGVPRWVGNLLAVLGSRQAEEINFLYFQNKSVPPLAILVSGGRLSAQSIPRIESFIEEHIKGKKNFHKVLILEAEPAG
ncbi:MAG: phage portal protein, partial [Thermoleophilia bacterium]|nr:phage portal protein [Thermoleophilia bacterium]